MKNDKEQEIFKKTGTELRHLVKTIKILPIISYLCVVFFIGFVMSELSNLGNASYVISMIVLPIIGGISDWFSDTDVLSTFKKEWSKAPPKFHLLVIATTLIYHHDIGEFKKYESK